MAGRSFDPCIVVRYSKRDKECVWCDTVTRDASDGPAAAQELVRRFARAAEYASLDALRIRVVPARPGGLQLEVKPVLGQSVAAFLEHACVEDGGAYQLRAEFDAASAEGFVRVRVAFPGTAPSAAAASSGAAEPLVEQFECKSSSEVADLKRMIESRTRFPANKAVLVLGCRRLHDELPMSRVAAAAKTAGTPLVFHLASMGCYVFLRREGQGHHEPSGNCTLKLLLPGSVQGAQERRLPFNLAQTLDELRWSVQAVSGLPPANMQFALVSPTSKALEAESGEKTLAELCFADGCTLKVSVDLAAPADLTGHYDMPLDTPTAGCASALYERAADMLRLSSSAHLSICIGSTPIPRSSDLSAAPLADGVVLSAYTDRPLQLSISVLKIGGEIAEDGDGAADRPTSQASSTSSTSSSAAPAASGAPADPAARSTMDTVACFSSDSIEEVRERVASAAGAEATANLRACRVFALDRSVWMANSGECASLEALARILGHFVPCNDGARLSRLGLADGSGHLVLVPERHLLVEVDVHIADEFLEARRLRVLSTCRLVELTNLLLQEMKDRPLQDCPTVAHVCQWTLANSDEAAAPSAAPTAIGEDISAAATPSARGVVAMVGNAAAAVAKVKRKSFGGGSPASSNKRRKSFGQAPAPNWLSDGAFVGDLYMQNPVGPKRLPSHLRCPITLDMMREPVIVSGSGNTYDRSSIEQHFQHRHTDPISNVELRRASDRRLVPNNSLRSQIDECERSLVDLRLAAHFNEQRRGGCCSDSPRAYLGWYVSLLRGPAPAR